MFDKIQKSIEIIINEFTSGDFFREVYEAKKEYFDYIGQVPEDDPNFENQMDLFMGWYLFDRPLREHQLPPVSLYYRKNLNTIERDFVPVYKALTEFKHSIYELVKVRTDSIVIRDLGNGEKYDVDNAGGRLGFSRGDLFEARIIPVEDNFFFANGFCFHPKGATKFIESQMKKVRGEDVMQRVKILMSLAQMKSKHQRFPHIDLNYIYTLTPKF